MEAISKRALGAGGLGAGLAVLKRIPVLGEFVEGLQEYHTFIENEQRDQFSRLLSERVNEFEKSRDWYATDEGQRFTKKVTATALNAEYAEKLEYLANALMNGPKLGDDEARRMKFVEMIRQLSKPALDVMIASLEMESGPGQVIPEEIANRLRWHPSLVHACVQELEAMGAYSHITHWERRDGQVRAAQSYRKGVPAVTDVTRELARFIQQSVESDRIQPPGLS